ncbi:MAG: hypothetical protein ACFCD0_04980 [Gemmataceae bacterium]
MADLTPHQQKIVNRYYNNLDKAKLQRLEELVTELYLAEGKKRAKYWNDARKAMEKIGVPQSRIDHLVELDKPEMLAELVKELHAKK